MPFTAEHHYVSVIGDCYGAKEKWQFGFRVTFAGASNEAMALALAPHIEDFWTATAPYSGSNAIYTLTTHRLTELKVATVDTDGAYSEGTEAYSHFYLPPIAGTNAPPSGMVPQNALAVTLVTGKPRGLASKGRIYLPPIQAMSISADGLLPPASALGTANAVNILIGAINAEPLVGNVVVMSKGKGVGTYDAVKKKIIYTYPNPGATENVTGTACGRVVDTQRRRRRQLVETYENDTN